MGRAAQTKQEISATWLLLAAGTTLVLAVLAFTGIFLIVEHHMRRGALPENAAPQLATIRVHYAQTMSDLAIHTTRFSPASAQRAKRTYRELRDAVQSYRHQLENVTDLPPVMRKALEELLEEIALAAPAVDRIGVSLIDAGQGFSALYGMERALEQMTDALQSHYAQQLIENSRRERVFITRLTLLVGGAILFSGVVVMLLSISKSRMADSYRRLRETASELKVEKARAEAASAAKSRFLATMSHEMRTPLNGVIGLAQLQLHGEMDERSRHLAEKIYESAVALVTLINEVLDASAIEAGTLRINAGPFRIADLVASACTPFEAVAISKGLKMEVRLADELPAAFIGDEIRLRQVLQNLIGNAVKFTERGHIQLDVGMGESDMLRFALSDTGPGIPEEEQARVFERFHQIDNTHTRRHGGSGLGLAISREIVEMMHGSLTLMSVPGEGSCFTVRVPLTIAGPDLPDREEDRDREFIAAQSEGMPLTG